MARQWMPMFWGDYIKDTMHLSTLEHGAYLLLISHCWNTRKPIPDDDSILRRITRTSTKQWKAIRPTIQNFFLVESGTWQHERVNSEVRTSEVISSQQSSKAKERWENEKKQQPSDAAGKATAIPRARVTTTTLSNSKEELLLESPPPISKEPKSEEEDKRTKAGKLAEIGMLLTKWEDYCKQHEIRCNVTLEVERFTQYCLSGKGTYSNYQAAFRNWLLRRKEDHPHGTKQTNRPSPRPDKAELNKDSLIESARQQGLIP